MLLVLPDLQFKTQDIQFTVIWKREKQEILREAGTREVFLLDFIIKIAAH